MKFKFKYKFIISIIALFTIIFAIQCWAGVAYEYLETDGTDWSDKSMTTATGTYYSDAIEQTYSKGFASLLILTSAGSLAITYEVSDDGTNFYTPYDTAGNALNSIATALTADRWIVFSPSVANYIRFKFVLTTTNSTVSALYRQVE
jgi:hypothetical protein